MLWWGWNNEIRYLGYYKKSVRLNGSILQLSVSWNESLCIYTYVGRSGVWRDLQPPGCLEFHRLLPGWPTTPFTSGSLSDSLTLIQCLSWQSFIVWNILVRYKTLVTLMFWVKKPASGHSSEIKGTQGLRGGRSSLGHQEQHLWQSSHPF